MFIYFLKSGLLIYRLLIGGWGLPGKATFFFFLLLEGDLPPLPLPPRSRWGPAPVLRATTPWLWHDGEAYQVAGQLLPGGDPQDGRLPL